MNHQAETDRTLHLPPYGRIRGKVLFQEQMKNERGLWGKLKKMGIIYLEEIGFQILVKGSLVEFNLTLDYVYVRSRETVCHLGIHIFFITHLGKLRPEGDIYTHGQ